MSAIMRLRRGEPFDVRRVDGADHRACMELVHGVYVASVPMWTDLNWFDGLHGGNDRECKRIGFIRGCV